jgi:hypothetical protein
MTALRQPVSAPPMNIQFFMPSFVGLIAFSVRLCRLQTYAAWQLKVLLSSVERTNPMIEDAA